MHPCRIKVLIKKKLLFIFFSCVIELIFCFFFFSSSPQIIEELSNRLEKRESQLLVVSKDKARLEEECDNLKE